MSTAIRYNLAWNYVWENVPGWRKGAITDDLHDDKNGRFITEFIREVRVLAESEEDIPAVKTNYIIHDCNIVASGSFND